MPEIPTPEDALSYEHKAWLNDKVTQQMLKNFTAFEKYLTDNMISNVSTRDSESIHRTVFSLKSLSTLKKSITNTELFINNSNK